MFLFSLQASIWFESPASLLDSPLMPSFWASFSSGCSCKRVFFAGVTVKVLRRKHTHTHTTHPHTQRHFASTHLLLEAQQVCMQLLKVLLSMVRTILATWQFTEFPILILNWIINNCKCIDESIFLSTPNCEFSAKGTAIVETKRYRLQPGSCEDFFLEVYLDLTPCVNLRVHSPKAFSALNTSKVAAHHPQHLIFIRLCSCFSKRWTLEYD